MDKCNTILYNTFCIHQVPAELFSFVLNVFRESIIAQSPYLWHEFRQFWFSPGSRKRGTGCCEFHAQRFVDCEQMMGDEGAVILVESWKIKAYFTEMMQHQVYVCLCMAACMCAYMCVYGCA